MTLSDREISVMRLVSRGYDNNQICDMLCISMPTVKTHLANIYNKLSVSVDRKISRPSITRLRAVLIYLGLGKLED